MLVKTIIISSLSIVLTGCIEFPTKPTESSTDNTKLTKYTNSYNINERALECMPDKKCNTKNNTITKESETHGLCKTKSTSPTFIIKGDDVYDTHTKLTWKRCLVGQAWDGLTCRGDAQTLHFDKALAQYGISAGGWRIPNIDELATIRSGVIVDDAKKSSSASAGSINEGCIYPAYNPLVFPGVSVSSINSNSDRL